MSIDFDPWIAQRHFDSAIRAIKTAQPLGWLAHPRFKYVNLRIDLRTGSFIVYDQDGNPQKPKEVAEAFREMVEREMESKRNKEKRQQREKENG